MMIRQQGSQPREAVYDDDIELAAELGEIGNEIH